MRIQTRFHGIIPTSPWLTTFGQRYDDALKTVSRYKADFPALFAAICVRLGQLDEARAAVANALMAGTQLSIATEGFWPQIEPDRTAYLNDLRAGELTDLARPAQDSQRRFRVAPKNWRWTRLRT